MLSSFMSIEVFVKAAEPRLRHLQEEQDLQRKVNEVNRALTLHQASSELEMATLEEDHTGSQPAF